MALIHAEIFNPTGKIKNKTSRCESGSNLSTEWSPSLSKSAFRFIFRSRDEPQVFFTLARPQKDDCILLPAHPRTYRTHDKKSPRLNTMFIIIWFLWKPRSQTYCSHWPPRRLFASYLQYVYSMGRGFVKTEKEIWKKSHWVEVFVGPSPSWTIGLGGRAPKRARNQDSYGKSRR